MLNITVTFDNGATINTQINGTVQSVMAYYLGRVFNIGTTSDIMARAVKIDFHN